MSYAQWKYRRERVKTTQESRDNYYVAAGTSARVLENGVTNADVKNHTTRQDLTFTAAEETDAPPGWRAFIRSGYIIQFEEQDVFYGDLWTLF